MYKNAVPREGLCPADLDGESLQRNRKDPGLHLFPQSAECVYVFLRVENVETARAMRHLHGFTSWPVCCRLPAGVSIFEPSIF